MRVSFISQFSEVFISSFSNQVKGIKKTKVLAVALAAFALISFLFYRFSCSKQLPKVDQKALGKKNEGKESIKGTLLKSNSKSSPLNDISYKDLYKKLATDTPEEEFVEKFDVVKDQKSKTIYTIKDVDNNRSVNIGCPIETRVKVEGEILTSSTFFDRQFLHANYVNLAGVSYIITQVPKNFQYELFWKAIIMEKPKLILDLTSLYDTSSSYYPSKGKRFVEAEKKQILFKCIEEQSLTDGSKVVHYSYEIQQKDDVSPISVERFHYKNWKRQEVVSVEELNQLIILLKDMQQADNDKILIQSFYGIGRAGTIAVAYAMSKLIENKTVSEENLVDHVSRLVVEGRKQRGSKFVETPEQLQLIVEYSLMALRQRK